MIDICHEKIPRKAPRVRSVSGRKIRERKSSFLRKNLPAAKTAKKRFSPRIESNDRSEIEGQRVTQYCDFSLFPRPPNICKK